MMKVSKLVQKIESHYVGDDCVQIMTPYRNEITIFNKDGILFSHNVKSHIAINKYLDDERRNQFPYSNIPTHYSRDGLFRKFNYVNQLLDFEVPYIRVSDDSIVESFAVKDKNEALLLNKDITGTGTKKASYVTRYELEKLYTEAENKFILHLEDRKYAGEETFEISDFQSISSEEEIRNFIKEQVINGSNYFRKHINSSDGYNLLKNPIFLNYVNQCIDNFDLIDKSFNINLSGSRAIIVITNKNDISLQYVEAKYVSKNNYRIDSIDLPVNKYTLEQLKYLSSKILKTKEPKIPLRLNPGVTVQDIQEAKEKVKSLRK